MNFAFLVDISPSMLQCPFSNYSLLTLAKNSIEHFLKFRFKNSESRGDTYHLFSSNPQKPCLSSWVDDITHLNYQLKNLTFSPKNDLSNSFLIMIEILNQFRYLNGVEGYCVGKDPYKAEFSQICIFTDGCDPLSINKLEVFSNICKWDQQINVFQFCLPLKNEKKGKKREFNPIFEKIIKSSGGKVYFIDTYEAVFQQIENFSLSLRTKILVKLKNLFENNQKSKYFLSFLGNRPNLETISLNLLIKRRDNMIYRMAKFPFPEENDNYFIDFSKILNYKLAPDFPCERYDVENNELLFYFQDLEQKIRFYFPLYVRKNDSFNCFGLLKVVKNEENNDLCLELFCFPLEFFDFLPIYEEITILGENEMLIPKLESYFLKIPYYYLDYFILFFRNKGLINFAQKRWLFSTEKIDENLMLNYRNKLNEEAKLKKIYLEKFQISKKKHHSNYLPECCIFRKKTESNLIEQILKNKQDLFTKSEFSLDNNFQEKTLENFKNKEVQEMEKPKNDLRDIYLDENENKFIKEPIPYGNPFKLVIRNGGQKISIDGEINNEALVMHGQEIELERKKKQRKKKFENKRKISETLNNENYNNNIEIEEKEKEKFYSVKDISQKNIDLEQKLMFEYLIENSDKFIKFNDLINFPEIYPKKLENLKNFISNFLMQAPTVSISDYIHKKLIEILIINNINLTL